MAELDPEKIRYIIREKKKGRSSNKIGVEMKVCGRRAEQLYAQYIKTGNTPALRTPGRPKTKVSDHMRIVVADYFTEYGVGASALEKMIDIT